MNKRIIPGQLVYWQNEAATVLELNSVSELIIRVNATAETKLVRPTELRVSLPNPNTSDSRFIIEETEKWNIAVKRFDLIRPLLELTNRTANDVRDVSSQCGYSVPTLYRWIKQFESSGLVSSLVRSPRADKGKSRLSLEQEAIVQEQIETYYLREERPKVSQLHKNIKAKCFELDIAPPASRTISLRVQALEARKSEKIRFGSKVARQKYAPTPGKFPGADYPNDVVQIDHTPVDLIIVDPEHRLPIGRPYLTIAMDIASKMISGFYLTLEAPSASSAGLCIAHAVGQKDVWLAKRDITEEWPIYGKMNKIHMDNAREFRGDMLNRACEQHGIIREFRPKGSPNYGPHVERAFRTFMDECHTLPGTTFSNVAEKLDYNSENKACMTLDELDKWFAIFIVYRYNHEPHEGNGGKSPIEAYRDLIFGTSDKLGVGLPAAIEDEEMFRLDFTPYVWRTIQRSGVELDYVEYYSPVLNKWIGRKEKDNPRKSVKYIFARDPRDISTIYFLDPEEKKYFKIPYKDNSLPPISNWELKAAIREIRSKNLSDINEKMIFTGVLKMRELEEEAIEKTRLAKQSRASEKRKRRAIERRRNISTNIHESNQTKELPQIDDFDDDDIQPFDEIIIGE